MKCTALVLSLALGPDPSPVQLHESLGQRQAQSGARVAARQGPVDVFGRKEAATGYILFPPYSPTESNPQHVEVPPNIVAKQSI